MPSADQIPFKSSHPRRLWHLRAGGGASNSPVPTFLLAFLSAHGRTNPRL